MNLVQSLTICATIATLSTGYPVLNSNNNNLNNHIGNHPIGGNDHVTRTRGLHTRVPSHENMNPNYNQQVPRVTLEDTLAQLDDGSEWFLQDDHVDALLQSMQDPLVDYDGDMMAPISAEQERPSKTTVLADVSPKWNNNRDSTKGKEKWAEEEDEEMEAWPMVDLDDASSAAAASTSTGKTGNTLENRDAPRFWTKPEEQNRRHGNAKK